MTATQNNSFRGWIHLNLAQIVRALKAFAASTNPGCSDRHGAPVAPSAWGVTGADGLTSDMPVSGGGGEFFVISTAQLRKGPLADRTAQKLEGRESIPQIPT